MAEKKEYICTQDCFHHGHRFRRGDVVAFTEEQLPRGKKEDVRHFIDTENAPKGVSPSGKIDVAVNERKTRK